MLTADELIDHLPSNFQSIKMRVRELRAKAMDAMDNPDGGLSSEELWELLRLESFVENVATVGLLVENVATVGLGDGDEEGEEGVEYVGVLY